MELYVFNQDVELLGIVDEIEEMDWVRSYYDKGSCTIKALLTSNNLELLKKGHLVCKKDDLSDVMYIEHRELADEDDDESESLVVEGISLSTRILSSRITLGRQIEKGTADKIMENILLAQTNNHTDENRHIKRLVVDTSIKEDFTEKYEHNSLYKQLDEEFSTICQLDGCGYKMSLDLDNKTFIFKVYRGNDVSDRIIFSTAFDNITGQEYIESDSNHKNVAIVAGQGEEEDRDLIVYNNDKYKDLDRLELFVDARDIEQDTITVQKPDEDGEMEEVEEPIQNGENAVKLLEERAKEKLEETSIVKSYSASIASSSYGYRTDYDLGDIVSIRNDKWNIFYTDRITEITEEYNNEGMTIKIDFGRELPDLATKINQKLRRI